MVTSIRRSRTDMNKHQQIQIYKSNKKCNQLGHLLSTIRKSSSFVLRSSSEQQSDKHPSNVTSRMQFLSLPCKLPLNCMWHREVSAGTGCLLSTGLSQCGLQDKLTVTSRALDSHYLWVGAEGEKSWQSQT